MTIPHQARLDKSTYQCHMWKQGVITIRSIIRSILILYPFFTKSSYQNVLTLFWDIASSKKSFSQLDNGVSRILKGFSWRTSRYRALSDNPVLGIRKRGNHNILVFMAECQGRLWSWNQCSILIFLVPFQCKYMLRFTKFRLYLKRVQIFFHSC